MILPNWLYILREPEFRASFMQKKFRVNIHNVGDTTQFFETQKQSNFGQFTYDFKKMINILFGQINIYCMYFLGGISALHINF